MKEAFRYDTFDTVKKQCNPLAIASIVIHTEFDFIPILCV